MRKKPAAASSDDEEEEARGEEDAENPPMEEAEEEDEDHLEDADEDDDVGGGASGDPKKRKRAALTEKQLGALLDPVIEKLGRRFVTYDESKRVSDAKLDIDLVKASSCLLQTLYSAQPNLSFRRKIVYGGVKLQLNKRNENWKLTPSQSADDCETMCRRILNVCRCVSQALRKRPTPRWAQDLPWLVGRGSASGGATKPTAVDPARYVYGYDSFNRAAWRQPIGNAKAAKELSTRWAITDDEDGLAAPLAVWPDGHTRRMPQLTVGAVRQMKAGRQTRDQQGVYWEKTHPDTKHRIWIKNRADRGLLISMMEQQKQICSAQVKLFCKAGETEASEAARIRAAAVLIKLGEMYVAREVSLDELYARRDIIFSELGVVGGKRGRKTTAAVEEDDPVDDTTKTEEASSSTKPLTNRIRSKTKQTPSLPALTATERDSSSETTPAREGLDPIYQALAKGPFSDDE